jgi:hypothetical protein
VSCCTCISLSDSMVLLGCNFVQWNQSAPPGASDRWMNRGVDCCMSGHCCHSAFVQSQPQMSNLATLGSYFSPVCSLTHPNSLTVTCCLAFRSSSPPQHHSQIFSKTSQPPVSESIEHYRNGPIAAKYRKSPKTLQLLYSIAGVHLVTVSDGSVPG